MLFLVLIVSVLIRAHSSEFTCSILFSSSPKIIYNSALSSNNYRKMFKVPFLGLTVLLRDIQVSRRGLKIYQGKWQIVSAVYIYKLPFFEK
jgi:hypothetical protein